MWEACAEMFAAGFRNSDVEVHIGTYITYVHIDVCWLACPSGKQPKYGPPALTSPCCFTRHAPDP